MNMKMDALNCKCVEKLRNNNGTIKGYILEDNQGIQQYLEANLLKSYIMEGKIKISNLKLTSDNKLIDCKTKEIKYSGYTTNQLTLKLIEKLKIITGDKIYTEKGMDNDKCVISVHSLLDDFEIDTYYKKIIYGKSLWKDLNKCKDIVIKIDCKRQSYDGNPNIEVKGSNLIDYHISIIGRTHNNNIISFSSLNNIINHRLDKAELEIYRASKRTTHYEVDILDAQEFEDTTQWILGVLIIYTIKETLLTLDKLPKLKDHKELIKGMLIRKINRVHNDYRFITYIVDKILSGDIKLDKYNDYNENKHIDKIMSDKGTVSRKFRDSKGLMDLFKR